MNQIRTGILVVNLGTPDSPSVPDVRKYLKEFLLDKRVIDIPYIQRNLLVRGIIAPFRAPRSAKSYAQVWSKNGSPLLHYTKLFTQQLKKEFSENTFVDFAMRYQNPSIESALMRFKKNEIQKLIVFPLFPQYASATTGSVHEKVMDLIKDWQVIPEVKLISSFHNHPMFINALAEIGKKYNPSNYDHVLFSFHGLPERQIKKADHQQICLQDKCCDFIHFSNAKCYRAQCFDTARNIASTLNIQPENYDVCFQSRLGKTPWIKPYTTDIIKELASKNIKKVLVFSPAFVADCLETIFEISVEYQLDFEKLGGEKLQLVESLNDHPLWVQCAKELILH